MWPWAIALSAQGFAQSMARRMTSFADAPGDQRAPGLEEDLVRPDSIRIEVLPLYNPERRTAVFVVPGLIDEAQARRRAETGSS